MAWSEASSVKARAVGSDCKQACRARPRNAADSGGTVFRAAGFHAEPVSHTPVGAAGRGWVKAQSGKTDRLNNE